MTPNEIEELKVQKNINECLDEFESFRFNAGAGAGKTFALIQSLKYLLKNKLLLLQRNNQKIACVTYTNVAVKEIKERLGNSDFVIVSTIHEMLWDILNVHQPQLVECHYEKLCYELNKLNSDLTDSEDLKLKSKLKFFTVLSDEDKDRFKAFAFKTKDVYYQNINAQSKAFNLAYAPYKEEVGAEKFQTWLKNYSNFKEVVKRLYKQERYQTCKEKIENQDRECQKVVYDSTANTDRLDKMKFSHDTLLEYAKLLVEKFPMLRRLIIDKYPYFFIDEYQDTSANVVQVVKIIHDYSIQAGKKWLIGYFGDTAQNIYDSGVGLKIIAIHPNVKKIHKIFNRRSHLQVIQVINEIRNDDIKQKPFYDEKNNGLVEFNHKDAHGDEQAKLELTYGFLNKYQKHLNEDSSIVNKKN